MEQRPSGMQEARAEAGAEWFFLVPLSSPSVQAACGMVQSRVPSLWDGTVHIQGGLYLLSQSSQEAASQTYPAQGS